MNRLRATEFISQLKKRKVVRVALVYIIVGWIVMQVGELVLEGLGVPAWSLSLLIVLVLLGFPMALVLAWAYEITPLGIRKDSAGNIESIIEIDDFQDGAPSIAVLPFDDMSEKGNQVYFCEGMAEEILNALCKVANLRVASRVSAFQFGSKQTDIKQIGRKLRVQTVLEGSVRKSGENLRITTQLLNTSDGFHIWSRQFDRKLVDIFEIQEEIANSIVAALSVSLKRKVNTVQQHVDPKAYDFFLRGLSYFARHTTQDTVYARQMFEQAIDIDPEFGRAWAGIAITYGFEYMYFNASNVNLAEAKRTSERALELAPDLAEAHVSVGIACCMSQDYKKAEAEFENAIELDPNNYDAWYFFARAKVHEGDFGRALKLFERASRVRPEDFQSVLLQAQLYTSLDEKDKAIEVTRKGIERVRSVLELNPDDNRALNLGAFALLRLGQTEEATKWMSTSMRNAPMDSIIQYNGACFFSLAGDVEYALDCLENCLIKVGNISREWLVHDSDMDNIRNHPRYEAIISSFPE
ncbi:MAG: tetratricopeptide repeat protein [Xanthomonadales bacterium]|nr:tetratricopeptide repeat protein [Xanthomonadales bacterium]